MYHYTVVFREKWNKIREKWWDVTSRCTELCDSESEEAIFARPISEVWKMGDRKYGEVTGLGRYPTGFYGSFGDKYFNTRILWGRNNFKNILPDHTERYGHFGVEVPGLRARNVGAGAKTRMPWALKFWRAGCPHSSGFYGKSDGEICSGKISGTEYFQEKKMGTSYWKKPHFWAPEAEVPGLLLGQNWAFSRSPDSAPQGPTFRPEKFLGLPGRSLLGPFFWPSLGPL